MDILKEVLDNIKPTKKEELEVKKKITQIIKKIRVKDTKVMLGGSGAKGTWLKNSYDADIFVLFNYKKYKDRSSELSDILENNIKKTLKKIKRLHGSRDYFQYKQDNFTFEIVPILGIKKAEDAKNITDVSPLHSNWVNKKSNNKIKDDIRLLKQFCKANRVYGAESYIQGFSGYALEILTIHYKGFNNTIKSVSKWKDKEVIDVNKFYKNKQEVLFTLNKSKLVSPLIVIDPVQKDRNAAAAISEEKYNQLIKVCKDYLKKPNKDFFIIKEITEEELLKKQDGRRLILLEATPLSGKEDVVGCKLLKALNHIQKSLINYGFNIDEYSWSWDDKALFWLYLKEMNIDEEYEHKGPPLKMKKAVEIFKKKYNNSYDKEGIIYARVKRLYTNADEFIKNFIKNDNYLKEHVKEIVWKKLKE